MKKNVCLLAAVIAFGMMTFPVVAQESKILSVNVQTLKAWMEKSDQVTAVDVGALLNCMDAKIPGAVCIACDQAMEKNWPAGGKIVFYASYGLPDADCALINRTISSGSKDVYLLDGGLGAWRKAGNPVMSEKRIPRLAAPAVRAGQLSDWKKRAKNPLVIDIRSAKAYSTNHLDGAQNFPLDRLHVQYAEIPLDRSLLIVDEDGRTGLLAASYLARKGFPDVQRLQGGMAAFKRGTR